MAYMERDITRCFNGICNGCNNVIVFSSFRSGFKVYFRTTDVTGEVELPAGTEMVMPGDDAKFTVKLLSLIHISEPTRPY